VPKFEIVVYNDGDSQDAYVKPPAACFEAELIVCFYKTTHYYNFNIIFSYPNGAYFKFKYAKGEIALTEMADKMRKLLQYAIGTQINFQNMEQYERRR